MLKTLLFILTFSIVSINAQEFNRSKLDSIFNLYTNLRGVNTSDKSQKQIEMDPAYRKCGMGLVEEIKSNLSLFTLEQQTVLSKILQRPSLPKSLVTQGGFFVIHYTDTGNDAIVYDINLLAQALDSSYNFEVNYLGYPPPPSDGVEGGDGRYDVYVKNLGNLYGQTSSENQIGVSSFTSFMEMDNDFSGFYTQGINAARVTAAHEFHHAIQMGNYAPVSGSSSIRSSDLFFYEITSTAMEEFVFDSVNDYYGYMLDYFRNPERPLLLNNGYDLAIWNIYLQKNFGFGILKRQWEFMPTIPALDAVNESIIEKGSTLGFEMSTFGIWTHFTNSRSINEKYFEEAANYPLIEPTSTVVFNAPFKQYDMSVGPTANYFLKINLPASDGNFISIISNSDIQSATTNPNQVLNFSFSIFNDTTSGVKVINQNYSVSFSRDNQAFWNNSGILNNVVVYGDSNVQISNLEGETYAFPSPYKYSTFSSVAIAFNSKEILSNEVDLNVYSVGMHLTYVGKAIIVKSYLRNSKRYSEIFWNALDNDGNKLPSGVYIYVIKSGEDIYKGKLVIFND